MSGWRNILLIGLILAGPLVLAGAGLAQEDDDISSLFEDPEEPVAPARGYTGQAPMPPLPPTSPAPSATPVSPAPIPLSPPPAPTAPPPPPLAPQPTPLAPPTAAAQKNSPIETPPIGTPIETPLAPPVAPPAAASPAVAQPMPDIPRARGQVVAPPLPPWQRQSTESAAPFAAGGPLPDFDSSQGRWQRMDVGEYDRTRNAAPGQSPTRTAAPEAVVDNPPPPPGQRNSGQNQLRELFSDMLPPVPEEVPAATGAPTDRPLSPPPTSSTASGDRPLTPAAPPRGAQSPSAPADRPASPPVQPVPRPLAPPPVPTPPSRPTPSPDPIPDPQPEANPDPLLSSPLDASVMGRAGSLLGERSLVVPGNRRGGAAILPPATPESPKPARRAAKATGSKKSPPPAPRAANRRNPTPSTDGAKSPANPAPTRRPRPRAAAPKPNISVLVVNETGRPGVGENYLAVLSQMGYQVIGVTNGLSQPSGQTIITYQPGRQSQAQALARRLPGHKVMVQAAGSLPAGAVVTVR